MPVIFAAHAAQPRAFWLPLLLALHRSLVVTRAENDHHQGHPKEILFHHQHLGLSKLALRTMDSSVEHSRKPLQMLRN
jgi:hypothetical protein